MIESVNIHAWFTSFIFRRRDGLIIRDGLSICIIATMTVVVVSTFNSVAFVAFFLMSDHLTQGASKS